MGSSCKILLKGLRRSDEMIFSSILPLLSSRTNMQVALSSEENGDLTIVDVDSDGGDSDALALEASGHRVIRLATKINNTSSAGSYLQKPIRSLEAVDRIVESILSRHEKKKTLVARLNRWPKKEIIQSCLGSSRLCAIFIRNAISIEQAAKVSGLSYDQVLAFVNECREANCIELSEARENNQETYTAAMKSIKHANLFEKLRDKLYRRV